MILFSVPTLQDISIPTHRSSGIHRLVCEMDERKRGYEVVSELNDQKRARPSGDGGMTNSTDVTSRIGLSRSDFGKVIGKGGQTIANIRAKCGAGVKGTEVSEEKRLVSFLLFVHEIFCGLTSPLPSPPPRSH